MRPASLLSSCLISLLLAHQAHSACAPIRVGYLDQHRPPYYLGSGSREPTPPGASIDLIREIAAGAGCTIVTSRMPYLRMRGALEADVIDASPLDTEGPDLQRFAYPLDRAGRLDRSRSMRMHTVLFVRARDGLARDTDTARLLVGRRIGVMHGASITQRMRDAGARVDDGAADAGRNLEKLRLGRIDAFAVPLVSPGDMDALVAARYGNEIVRLDRPAQTHHIYLVFNKHYYARHREQVETMWDWIGTNGNTRFVTLVRKYSPR